MYSLSTKLEDNKKMHYICSLFVKKLYVLRTDQLKRDKRFGKRSELQKSQRQKPKRTPKTP
jgi:hypothetical protein